MVDERSTGRGERNFNRLGLLWLVFATVVTLLAVVRHPTKTTLIATPIVFAAAVLANATFLRLSARGGDGRGAFLRCLVNGPISMVAILVTGGFSSPIWMCSYQAVTGSTRESLRTVLLVTSGIIACQVGAYALQGLSPDQWLEVVGRGAFLIALSLFFRTLLQLEEEQRSAAEAAARSAERALASKQEAEARFRMVEQSAAHSKMASLGLLAAGVAHEINNPINTIINSSQIVLDGEAGHEGSEYFQRLIIAEGERIAKVVSNLLQFARGSGDDYGPIPLHRVVEKTLMLINYQLDKDAIRVVLEIPGDLPPIRARLEELQQVFLNLVTNARHALLERRRSDPDHAGLITITAATEARPRGMVVVVRVTDNGTGVAAEHIDRIFEPFFTTKAKDEGTGLGLSICYRIMSEHRGQIRAESRPGEETTFVLTFPAVTETGLQNSTGVGWTALVR